MWARINCVPMHPIGLSDGPDVREGLCLDMRRSARLFSATRMRRLGLGFQTPSVMPAMLVRVFFRRQLYTNGCLGTLYRIVSCPHPLPYCVCYCGVGKKLDVQY